MLEQIPSNTIRVLGIDPGLNNMGLANIVYDLGERKIVSIKATTISPPRLKDKSGLSEDDYAEFYRKLRSLKYYLKHHIEAFEPMQVVSESPFFDRRKPSSYEYLVAVMCAARDTVIDYNPNVPFTTAAPLEIKKWLGVAGKIGKEVVKEAFLTNETVLSVLKNPVESLNDHEIDAISAGCSWIELTLKPEVTDGTRTK